MEYSNGNSAYTQWNKQWCIYTLILNIQGNVSLVSQSMRYNFLYLLKKCKILFMIFYAINIFLAY